MAWGIGWGILIIALFVALISYVIIQETRAQQYWRRLVEQGDVDAIRRLTQQEIDRWRVDPPPRDAPPAVWRAVQTVELVEVGSDYAHVSCNAEGQYAMVGAQRREVSSALGEGMKATVRLADMLLYDIPHVRLDRIQIDVYTAFRGYRGVASQECILSTLVRRSDAGDLDWESLSPEEFVTVFNGRYRRDESGAPLPIEPDAEAVRVSLTNPQMEDMEP
jgi:hypothetical protein